MSICEQPKPVIAPGFQYKAPLASKGAAVEAPAIERLFGPAPEMTTPNWAWAAWLPAINIATMVVTHKRLKVETRIPAIPRQRQKRGQAPFVRSTLRAVPANGP